MRVFAIAFVILVFFGAFGCAAIQEQTRLNSMTDEEVEAYNADPKNTDKIVCKSEKPIGSNIPRRTCHTQSWIDDRSQQDQKAIEEIQRHTRPPGP